MKDTCFTILCWFLLCINLLWISHRYIYVPSLLKLPSTYHSIPHLYVVTEPWFKLPESYSKFPLAIYFTYGSTYVSNYSLHSSDSLLGPPPLRSTSLFSMFASPLLPENRFISIIFWDSIYICINIHKSERENYGNVLICFIPFFVLSMFSPMMFSRITPQIYYLHFNYFLQDILLGEPN